MLDVLRRRPVDRTPIWLMRQAGRYLPEYRAVRAEAKDFLTLCLTPELAVEVTLQPTRRYPVDAAILFSDILVLPYALGQRVWFVEGEGPRLEPIRRLEDLASLDDRNRAQVEQAVSTEVRAVRAALPPATALIGFAGAPWTVAAYMVEGGGSRDFTAVKSWAYREPETFGRLIDRLVERTADHLLCQLDAGADLLQIFDSWAGILPPTALERWSRRPIAEIVDRVRVRYPDVPVIVFPRGVGVAYEDYVRSGTGVALSLDQTVPLAWAADRLQPRAVLQGNLDPTLLLIGGKPMRDAALAILETLGRGPLIFNLGHGVQPETPPEHVAELCDIVQSWRP